LSATLPTAPFGRTGHQSTRVIFGAAAVGWIPPDDVEPVLELVTELGINHVDTAASYGDAEPRLASWLADRRGELFLATKTGERTGAEARASLERSLERMGVDHVDLVQLHNLVEEDDWQTAHGRDGAVAALAQARDEGLCRFVGITGHGLRIAAMHRRSLAEFDFDSVLLPYSYVLSRQPAYQSEFKALMAECAARDVAVQTIKAVARRRWPRDDDRRHRSWYEPLDEPAAIGRSVRWVLSHPRLFVNSSSDARLLRATVDGALDAGRGVDAPTDAELDADLDVYGVRPLFDGGELERI
jgi:aryl-alcohol dehydrogenase-like predicted oxidoreductase